MALLRGRRAAAVQAFFILVARARRRALEEPVSARILSSSHPGPVDAALGALID